VARATAPKTGAYGVDSKSGHVSLVTMTLVTVRRMARL
jgi:hypothetical protein